MSVRTLNDIYSATISIDRPAVLRYKSGERWVDVPVQQFADTVRHFSTGLRSLGVKRGDRVAILSENRPEWTMGDYAILAARAVTVPIYPTLLGWQIEYILNDSSAVAVICSTEEQVQKVVEICDHCPGLRTIIVCEAPDRYADRVVTFNEIRRRGEEIEKEEGRSRFDEVLRAAEPEDLATIVYTSGTTGNPKGAMLTHRNIASNVVASLSVLPFYEREMTLSILPLSHILERMVEFCYLYKGATIAYAESVVKVRDNLVEISPTVFTAVPRLFEKMKAAVLENVATMPPKKQKIFQWAVGIAEKRLPYRVERKPMPLLLGLQSAVADKLIFSKIQERLGGRVRFIVSGGAPLSPELAAFFIGAGVDIYEGYGLTETSPVVTANTPEHRKVGTVGRPIPGVEVRIAQDGEILTRGPHIMKGYWNNPEATAQTIDPDGWFHTGDIGEIDSEGYLRITDRKKDVIITAYGKNIAPQPLENLLKTSPYIGTPVLIGDRRKYLSALIVPNFEKLERDARSAGVQFASRDELVSSPKVRQIIQKEIDHFNSILDRQEKVRRFTLLGEDFSIEGGELTPSLKVKRKSIDEKYRDLIDSMYADETHSEMS